MKEKHVKEKHTIKTEVLSVVCSNCKAVTINEDKDKCIVCGEKFGDEYVTVAHHLN